MVRQMLGRIVGMFGRSKQSDDGDDKGQSEDESEFVPSRLDASVLEAHGMETTAAERELAQIQEKAEQLEELDERNHKK